MMPRRLIARAMGILCTVCVSIPVGPAAALDVAVPFVEADFMWAQGYTGSGVEIGVIDLYLADQTHPALSGNYLGSEKFVNGAGWVGSHATAVIGAAVSQDATFRGPAPDAGWWTAQTTNRGSITKVRKQTLAAETFAQGLRGLGGNPVEVITLSIGLGGDSAGGDQWSLALDHIVNTEGRTITVAAGNDGPDGGSVMGRPPGAFNVITVGATGEIGGTPLIDYGRVVGFSSRGPTDDGRAKPDIVAPGSMLRLPTLGSGWIDGSGTSFATPLVAGGAALLMQMGGDLGYSTDPKVVKSILLNSADKLAGWTNTSTRPLDFAQGAGQMNLREAYLQYLPGEHAPGAVPGVGWDTEQVTESAENVYLLDLNVPAGEFITATLVWDRIVTTDTEDVETAVYGFDHLDNLDLFLYRANDLTTPLATSASTIDNVEHLYFLAPTTGRYAIGVRMSDAASGDLETYALAWGVVGGLLGGDVDLSGCVDDDDLSLLLANWGAGDEWGEGDLNDDGAVNDDDLSLLLANWGPGCSPAPDGATVPEPASSSLLLLGALALIRRRRRSSSAEGSEKPKPLVA